MGGYTGSHPVQPALGTWGWGVTQDPVLYILHWEHGGGGLHRIPSCTSCTGNMGVGGYTGSHPVLGTWGWGVTQDPTPYILHWEHGGGFFFTQDPTPYILHLMGGGGVLSPGSHLIHPALDRREGYFTQDPTLGALEGLPYLGFQPIFKDSCYGRPCWIDMWQWAFHWCDTATCTATCCHTHTCYYRHCGLGLVC